MRRQPRWATAAASAILGSGLLFAMTACTGDDEPAPAATEAAPEIDSHESGPASPIAYGLTVPTGAVQLGPLVRYRSPALIAAYTPALEAAEAEQAAEDAEESTATPTTETTEPTEDTKPEGDTFALLDEPPRPDTFVSLMRVDGRPTTVVRRMLGELSVLLPDAGVVTDDLSAYCRAENDRVLGCDLDVSGTTPGGRDLRVQLTVDPGNVTTRTGNVASQRRPVMTVTVAYVGDPRAGQANRDAEDLDDPPSPADSSEATGWIWPKMDVDASAEDPMLGSWSPPTSATVLLSSPRNPLFAAMTTPRGSIATEVAEGFLADRITGAPSRDVISNLNEVITTTWGTNTATGAVTRTVHVVSARGNYLTVFETPAARVTTPKSALPTAPASPPAP